MDDTPEPDSGDTKTLSAPAPGSTKSSQGRKRKAFFSDALKDQLQTKSRSRRKGNAAQTKVATALSRPRRNDLQPSMKTVSRPIGALRPSPTRARVTEPEYLEKVVTSISQFGVILPILIDSQDQIVAGHTVWEAAKELGLQDIECRVIDHLDAPEIEALSLALNRIGEVGCWDLPILRERMIAIENAGIELTTTGFTLPQIDQILIGPAPTEDELCEADDGKEHDAPIVTVLGDLFALNDHRLLCGDALAETSYEMLLAGRQAQCVFSDPPYNCPIKGFVSGLGKTKHTDFVQASGEMSEEEFLVFLAAYLALCKVNASFGAVIFACMDWRQIHQLLSAAHNAGLARINLAVWDKGSGGMGSLYRSAHELIAVFCNGQKPATNNVELGRHGRDRTNLWSYPGANRRGSSANAGLADHPTSKPVELVEDALLDVTNRGDLVLDPFMGGGSTLMAAERSGRIACGIELDPKYVDRTIRRWERVTGEEAVHLETGLTFRELTDQRAIDALTSSHAIGAQATGEAGDV